MTVEIEKSNRQNKFGDLYEFAKTIANSDFVPVAWRNQPGQVLAAMKAADELGLGYMQALRVFYSVDKSRRLGMMTQAKLALALRSGNVEDIQHTWISDERGRGARVTIKRRGVATPVTRDYTEADARAAGLLGRGSYAANLDQMLMWRAMSRVLDVLFADSVLGLENVYEAEEVAPEPEEIVPEKLDMPQGPPKEWARVERWAEKHEIPISAVLEDLGVESPSEVTEEQIVYLREMSRNPEYVERLAKGGSNA